MKKISYKRLAMTFLIIILTTLVPACFQIQPTFDAVNVKLMLGFPFDFYMIKFAVDKFWFHFNIAGFLANTVSIYIVLTFFVWALKKVKGGQK